LATAPISNPPALPPMANTFVLGAVARGDEMTRDVDEVGEGMHLVESAPVVVPGAAHFLAAAHMRDGIDEAAIEQTQARRRKARIGGQPVGAIGVLQQRRGAVELDSARYTRDTGMRVPSRAVANRNSVR
jgi:hypothetical protein